MPSQDAGDAPAPLRVLWVGDAGPAQQFIDHCRSLLHVTACDGRSLQALIEARAAGHAQEFDGVVIDTTETTDIPRLVGTVEAVAPNLALVLIVPPQPDGGVPGLAGLGITDCVAKTPDFMHQIVPALMQVRARQDLMTVFRATSEREARLRSILDMQPAVAVLVDPAGRMTAVNRAGLQLFGDPAGTTIVGRVFLEFVPEVERAGVRALLSQDSPAGCVEHTLIRADGSLLYVRTRAAAFPHRDGAASLITIDDQAALRATREDDAERARLARLVEAQAAELELLHRTRAADQDEEWEDVLGEEFDATERREESHDSADRSPHAELEAENQRLLAELLEAQERSGALHAELQAERKRLSSALQEAVSRAEELTRSAKHWEVAGTQAEASALRQAEAIATLQNERARLEGELQAARSELQRLSDAHQQRDVEVRATSDEARRLKDDLDAARQDLESSAAEYRALVEKAGADRERLTAMLGDALSDLQALAGESNVWEQAIASARLESQARENALATLAGERDRLAASLQEIGLESRRLTAELELSREAVSTARMEVAAARSDASQAFEERDRLESAIREMQADLERAVAESTQLKLKAGEGQHDSEAMREELARLAAERDRLESMLQTSLADLQHIVEVSEHWEQLANGARRQCELLQVSHSAVQRELAKATVERSLIAAERDRLSGAVRAALSCLQGENAPSATAPASAATAPVEIDEPPLLPHSFAASALALDAGGDPSTAPAGRERRRHPRIPGMFDGERVGLIDTPLQIQNLSVGGCFISTCSPPPAVSRFDMRIDLGIHGVVDATVKIAFVAEEIGYGVSFVSMTDAARRQVAAAVEAGNATGHPAVGPARITSAAWVDEGQAVVAEGAGRSTPATTPSNASPFVN